MASRELEEFLIYSLIRFMTNSGSFLCSVVMSLLLSHWMVAWDIVRLSSALMVCVWLLLDKSAMLEDWMSSTWQTCCDPPLSQIEGVSLFVDE
jgi:hypothetical protein